MLIYYRYKIYSNRYLIDCNVISAEDKDEAEVKIMALYKHIPLKTMMIEIEVDSICSSSNFNNKCEVGSEGQNV